MVKKDVYECVGGVGVGVWWGWGVEMLFVVVSSVKGVFVWGWSKIEWDENEKKKKRFLTVRRDIVSHISCLALTYNWNCHSTFKCAFTFHYPHHHHLHYHHNHYDHKRHTQHYASKKPYKRVFRLLIFLISIKRSSRSSFFILSQDFFWSWY